MTPSKVLVAIDGSEISSRAVTVGADFAASFGGQLALVTVVDPRGAVMPESGVPAHQIWQMLREEAEGLLKAAGKEATACPPAHRFVREGQPGAEICASAREWGADMIVIGTHGRGGLSRLLMGSTAEAVVRHAPCPVLVIPASSCGGR